MRLLSLAKKKFIEKIEQKNENEPRLDPVSTFVKAYSCEIFNNVMEIDITQFSRMLVQTQFIVLYYFNDTDYEKIVWHIKDIH